MGVRGRVLRYLIFVLLTALWAGAPAEAQRVRETSAPAVSREPQLVPMPSWVDAVDIPSPDPALRDRPMQLLLTNAQSRYTAERADHFVQIAMLVQNAQGLQAVGNVILPWEPEQSALLVHEVKIIRNGTVIDLLANGQHFTVLRRENHLESAMLDGTLTAVMQAEGLAVGDILKVSWTMRRQGGALPPRGQNLFALTAQPLRQLSVRQVWAPSLPVRWRASGAFEPARTRTTALGTELSVTLRDVVAPEPPASVPSRYRLPSLLQLTQYRDWAEIGTLLAPHYDRAAQIAAGPGLQAEIDRIAASSPDPRARILAALHLVQDQVRYFAILMGDGNYLPASAEQTWSRRYGDCKGKSALLLALLRGLGIDAEAVMVNTQIGDSLNDRLPMLSVFNHVIVRARIDGRSYWLDGTRTDDRNIDDLASSTFGWGLPISTAAGGLERLPLAPPSRPLSEFNVTYDGSRGLGGPVPMRLEQVNRGDNATLMRLAVSQLGREDFLRQMRESMANADDEMTIEELDVRDDPETGEVTLIMTGRTTLSWNPLPGSVPSRSPRRYRFDDDLFSWRIEAERPEGPFSEAPVALAVPLYEVQSETVLLPAGRGFRLEGESFDRTIGGTQFVRRTELSGNRATVRTEIRRLEPEISSSAAVAANAQIEAIAEDDVYLTAPLAAVRTHVADGN